MPKDITKLEDLTPDDRNLNKGTKRGLELLAKSLEKFGAGRSILVDRDGRVIAGNKTLEQAVDMGLEVHVVKTDGKRLVVVQREDISLETPQGREFALADNRVSQVDFELDLEQLAALTSEGLDVSDFYFPEEITELVKQAQTTSADAAVTDAPELQAGDKAPFRQMTFTVHDSQHGVIEAALSTAKLHGKFDGPNENSNGNALHRICQKYLELMPHEG